MEPRGAGKTQAQIKAGIAIIVIASLCTLIVFSYLGHLVWDAIL